MGVFPSIFFILIYFLRVAMLLCLFEGSAQITFLSNGQRKFGFEKKENREFDVYRKKTHGEGKNSRSFF